MEIEDDFKLILASNSADNAEEAEDDPPTTDFQLLNGLFMM